MRRFRRDLSQPLCVFLMEDPSFQPHPSSTQWVKALDSWSEFALGDLKTELSASPDVSSQDADQLLSRAKKDLTLLRQQFLNAVSAGVEQVDLSGTDGLFNRLTRAARRRLAALEASHALPLPVTWPARWHTLKARDASSPDGTETPPTRPSTPRGA